jgi:hypothetical protein
MVTEVCWRLEYSFICRSTSLEFGPAWPMLGERSSVINRCAALRSLSDMERVGDDPSATPRLATVVTRSRRGGRPGGGDRSRDMGLAALPTRVGTWWATRPGPEG